MKVIALVIASPENDRQTEDEAYHCHAIMVTVSREAPGMPADESMQAARAGIGLSLTRLQVMIMARLSEMPEWEREHHLEKIRDLPDFGPTPWGQGPPLARRRVAIVTTAGLQRRDDVPFKAGSADYRIIPVDTLADDIVMSHVSVNYDRTGFQEDLNVVFPIERLREAAASGTIGSMAAFHYAFMGAAPIRALEEKARGLAGLLQKDRVDAVLLSPV